METNVSCLWMLIHQNDSCAIVDILSKITILNISKDIGDFIAPDKVATENKSTLTSASLLRKKNEDQVKMQDRLQVSSTLIYVLNVPYIIVPCLPITTRLKTPLLQSPIGTRIRDK